MTILCGTLVISIFSSRQFMRKWSNLSLTPDLSHAPKIPHMTPELNPSENRRLPEFFTGDFKF
jgi:hypothetical protein